MSTAVSTGSAAEWRTPFRGAVARERVRLSDAEIARAANFLSGVVQSLCVPGRAGAPPDTTRDVVAAARGRLG
jgi:hypothetical protein